MWVHTLYGPYLFGYDITVIQKCLMSLLGLRNNQTVLYTVLSSQFIFSLVSPASQSRDEEYSLSFPSSYQTAEKENIKKVCPSLV